MKLGSGKAINNVFPLLVSRKCSARCIPYLKDSRERPALGRKVRIELIRAAKLELNANKNSLAHHHYRARRHAHLFISIRLCRACIRETRNYTTWTGGDRPGQFPSNPHASYSSSLILNTHKQFSYNTLTLWYLGKVSVFPVRNSSWKPTSKGKLVSPICGLQPVKYDQLPDAHWFSVVPF